VSLHLTREVTQHRRGRRGRTWVSSIMRFTGQSRLPIVIVGGWAQAAAFAAIAAQLFQYDPGRFSLPGVFDIFD